MRRLIGRQCSVNADYPMYKGLRGMNQWVQIGSTSSLAFRSLSLVLFATTHGVGCLILSWRVRNAARTPPFHPQAPWRTSTQKVCRRGPRWSLWWRRHIHNKVMAFLSDSADTDRSGIKWANPGRSTCSSSPSASNKLSGPENLSIPIHPSGQNGMASNSFPF